jgi:two-component system sensor histidine kinase KdpD
MQRIGRHLLRLIVIAGGSLAIATAAVATLENTVNVENASAAYLVAVVVVALTVGTDGAVITAIGSAALYNYLFTDPRYTFVIHDPGVLLSVVLLLFVGVVVGQLAALQRSRAETARASEREARALFMVSRAMATRDSLGEALAVIARTLREQTGMDRVWIGIGPDPAEETTEADTGDGQPPSTGARFRVLQRAPGDEPARWTRVQRPTGPGLPSGKEDTYRVRIDASGETLGSIWALRRRDAGEPDVPTTRLLAAAADQVGQGLAHDRAAERTRAAEVARQSDALKSALLQSVSHDLRTPLATIRAAAGSLRPGEPVSDADRQASADLIEREVAYLNRLVTNLLDLSRIEAGALRARRDVYELDDLVARPIESLRTRLRGATLEVDLVARTVEVDAIFIDEALTNILDNALKYGGDDVRIRVSAADGGATVSLTVEDDGPGVPDDQLALLFDKFYRVPGTSLDSRPGTGIGLAVAKGLVEATGGRATARRSAMGGLAIELDLPAGRLPAGLAPPALGAAGAG